MPDPKWLEILKATGWQTAALAAAFTAFLLLSGAGAIPELAPVAIQLLTLGALICGCLALASLATELLKVFPLHVWLAQSQRRNRDRLAVEAYIPHMTEEELEIVGYLLHKNQKSFTCAQDGGHAMTLISRGIVVLALRPGQAFTVFDMPVVIPDHIWEVLVAHKDKFPAPPRGKASRQPWREMVV